MWVVADPALWSWQAKLWPNRPWTLWTASLVHLSIAHLLGNLAALLVIGLLGVYVGATRGCVAALLHAWPLGTMALGLWPQLERYAGLSGTLCAMLAILAVHASTDRTLRPVSLVLFASLALKLLAEHAWSQPIGYDPAWGFNVVYAAHLTGAAAGAAAAAAAALMVWRKPQVP